MTSRRTPTSRISLRLRASRISAAAGCRTSADSVAAFRIAFGAVSAFAAIRFLASGWVGQLYLSPRAHLTYPGFGWIQPLPAPWMHLVVAVIGAAGVAIALGWRFRLACWVFLCSFAYVELIDTTLYLNHYWFVTLCALLLALLPAHHRWSLDARAGRVRAGALVPVGVIWTLRAQVAIVYLFAGIAKLNTEWLGSALPLRLWLADRADLAVVGPLLDEPWIAYAASWASAAFDCTIVFWLLWRRSRPWAFAAVVVFHFATGALFAIGVFPLVMVAAALIFFEPDWPRQLAARAHLVRRRIGGIAGRASTEHATQPASVSLLPLPLRDPPLPVPPDFYPASRAADPRPRLGRGTLVALAALALMQLALPLRHLTYAGDVRWTEEGYWGA